MSRHDVYNMIYKHIFQIIIHTKRSSWNLIFWGGLFYIQDNRCVYRNYENNIFFVLKYIFM